MTVFPVLKSTFSPEINISVSTFYWLVRFLLPLYDCSLHFPLFLPPASFFGHLWFKLSILHNSTLSLSLTYTLFNFKYCILFNFKNHFTINIVQPAVQSNKEISILILSITTYNKDNFKLLLKFSGPCVFTFGRSACSYCYWRILSGTHINFAWNISDIWQKQISGRQVS